jgi:hypothetical protein
MIVHLNQDEMHEALIQYIGNQGYPVENREVTVTLIAGRKGKKGHSAQLSFDAAKREEVSILDMPEEPDDNQQAIMFEMKDPDED